jgi:CheY-like chemotaxis protein
MMGDVVLRRRDVYEILFASDGAQAVAMARMCSPDIILLDLNMPELSGLEVLRELKRSSQTREVPVIVVTASPDHAMYKAAAESGCDGFLTKPFRAETLLLSVEKSLGKGRSRAPKTSLDVAGCPQ